jgi:hypothetical protein
MTIPQENSQTQTQPQAAAVSDKELNFRNLENRYEKMLQEERQKRLEAETALQKKAAVVMGEDEEEDSEPYVDRRRLEKKLNQNNQKIKAETQTEIQKAVGAALEKERQQQWLRSHPDFYEVMQHAQAFAEKNPELAEDYLELQEADFKKQKMVYNNIKAVGMHKKEEPKPSIQDTINNNKKGLYYNPSGVGSAPYQGYIVGGKDFSVTEQQNAFNKMKELQAKLRLG